MGYDHILVENLIPEITRFVRTAHSMASFARFITAGLVFLAVYYFSLYMLFGQIFPENLLLVADFSAQLAATGSAILIWRSMRAKAGGILAITASWAAIAGAIGFCGGFFGPIIFTPGANQGPLLGLFVTGPLSFIAGGICGLIYALWRRPGNTRQP